MAEGRLVVRMNPNEKELLRKNAKEYGYSISEYAKRKLFDENEDMFALEERYISPQTGKHNVFTATALYKIISLMMESLKLQGAKPEEVMELEKQSLKYARNIREKYGYKVIRSSYE